MGLRFEPVSGVVVLSAISAGEASALPLRWQTRHKAVLSLPNGQALLPELDENGNLGFEERYHASGHASGEAITWAIEQIDPDYIVPIHTEARDWFAKSFENVMLVEEGERYNL